MPDLIDVLREQKRRIGGTPQRFSIVELSGKRGREFSVESVYGPAPGLWDSLQVCEIDEFQGQQCSDMFIVSIHNVVRIVSF